MIETLQLTTPPTRWKSPDLDSTFVTDWPLFAQLIEGAPDRETQGILASLQAIANTFQIQLDLDVSQMSLPTTEDLADAVSLLDQISPALLEECPLLKDTFSASRRGSDTDFHRGLILGYAVWYLRLTRSSQETDDEDSDFSGIADQPAFSIDEAPESVEDDDNNLDDETYRGENTTEASRTPRLVADRGIRQICIDLSTLPLTVDLTLVGNAFVLTVVLNIQHLTSRVLEAVEESFAAINPNVQPTYVGSPTNQTLVTSIKISEDAVW
jgi:hypothetical protein